MEVIERKRTDHSTCIEPPTDANNLKKIPFSLIELFWRYQVSLFAIRKNNLKLSLSRKILNIMAEVAHTPQQYFCSKFKLTMFKRNQVYFISTPRPRAPQYWFIVLEQMENRIKLVQKVALRLIGFLFLKIFFQRLTITYDFTTKQNIRTQPFEHLKI